MKRVGLKQSMDHGGAATFLANRANGRIVLVAGADDGETRRRHVFEDGPLRVRFPTPETGDLEAVMLNTAGGIAGGDQHDIDVAVEDRARIVVTTAAAEKVYRSLGPDSAINVRLKIDANARLAWLPQETILFDRARLSRRIDVELAGNAAVTMAEAVIFGRSAMKERVIEGFFTDRWRVRRDGRLLFAENVRLGGAIDDTLGEPGVAAGGVAVATVLSAPGDDSMASNVRALRETFAGEVGVSAWNGILVARLCAKDGASLRGDLVAVLSALSAALPRLWLN